MTDPTRFWTPAAFAEITGGHWLTPPADADARLAGLGIDSRALAPGEVFVAIAGEHNRLNASAAIAVARLFGIPDARIEAGHAPMRGDVIAADDPSRPNVISDASNAKPTEWSDVLAADIADGIPVGAMLLLKGSRGMVVERLLPALEARFSGG